jgi:hypothetical protein
LAPVPSKNRRRLFRLYEFRPSLADPVRPRHQFLFLARNPGAKSLPLLIPSIFSPKSYLCTFSEPAATMQRSTGHQTSAAAQRLASSRRPFVAPSNTAATRFPSPTGVHGSSNGGVGLHSVGIDGSPTSAGFHSSPSSGAGFHSSLSSGPGFQLGSGIHSSSPRGGPSPGSRPSFGPFSSASSASSMASGPSSTYSDLLHR